MTDTLVVYVLYSTVLSINLFLSTIHGFSPNQRQMKCRRKYSLYLYCGRFLLCAYVADA